MIKQLANLLNAAKSDGAPSREITEALDGARKEAESAAEAVSEAERAYNDGLLTSSDAQLRQLAEARTTASIRKDRAIAIVTALELKLEAAQAREADAAKRKRHADAVKARKLAMKTLRDAYPEHARAILGILKQVAEAEALITQVNADLPDGEAPLQGVETSVRSIPTDPREELEAEVVERWVYSSSPEWMPSYVAEKDVATIREVATGVYALNGTSVQKRRFRKVTFLPQRSAIHPMPLASELRLPAVHVTSGEFWRPCPAEPALVLATIERVEAALAKPGMDPRLQREPETETVPIRDQSPEKAA